MLLLPAILLAGSSVRAAEPPPAPPPPSAAPDDGGWYGQVPALVDGLSVAAFLGGLRLDETEHDSVFGLIGLMGIVGLMSGVVVAPLNHIQEHHPGRAAASLGMRLLGLVTLVAIERANTTPCQTQESPNCSYAARFAFEGLPWFALMAIDDGLLAWRPSSRPAAPVSPAPSFDAMISVVRGAPGLVLVGTF